MVWHLLINMISQSFSDHLYFAFDNDNLIILTVTVVLALLDVGWFVVEVAAKGLRSFLTVQKEKHLFY